MKKTKILKISEIEIDEELYPRYYCDEDTANKYFEAMTMGDEFPDIAVALIDGKYILVDGRHRIEAYKLNSKDFISAEILVGLDRKQIFIEAVKRNVKHGRPFENGEIEKIQITLKEWNMSKIQIKEITRQSVIEIKPFEAVSIKRDTGLEIADAMEGEGELDGWTTTPNTSKEDNEIIISEKLIVWLTKLKSKLTEFDLLIQADNLDMQNISEDYEGSLEKINECILHINHLVKIKEDLVEIKNKLMKIASKNYNKKNYLSEEETEILSKLKGGEKYGKR